MPLLLDLPNELLLNIFTACSTLYSAAQLAQTNQRLHAIWFENANLVVEEVLQHQVPAYKDAIELAKVEAGFDLSVEPAHVPIKDWISRLSQNAEFAETVARMHQTRLDDLPLNDSRRAIAYTSRHASYYTIRQIVLSFHRSELRPALRDMLKSQSEQAATTHGELSLFMCLYMDDMEGGEEERLRQGLPKPSEEWTPDDELYSPVNKDEWVFAQEECQHAFQVAKYGFCDFRSETHDCNR